MTTDSRPGDSVDFSAITASLTKILRAVHSSLIQSLKKRREAATGKEISAVEWFHLLSGGPEYRWMHPLTEAMSDIDALLDNRHEVSSGDFAVVREALLRLFDSPLSALTSADDFKNKYFDALAADPDLILSHAALKKTLDELPEIRAEGSSADIRRSWHISERRLAHMRTSGKPK